MRQLKAFVLGTVQVVWIGLSSLAGGQDERPNEPVVGLPCEGCEAVFQGLPETFEWSARIAPVEEPGEPMRIEGTVRNGEGRAVPGVIVYAYHTDAMGLYPANPAFRGSPPGGTGGSAGGR